MARAKKMTLRAARANTLSKRGKPLTIKEAAQLIGIHYQTLRNWEIGKSVPTVSDLERICKAYNVSYDNLKI